MNARAKRHDQDFAKAKIVRRGPKPGTAVVLPLRDIREAMGKTQKDVAAKLDVDQADVSRRENRKDALVSSLRESARALGLKCEVTFVSDLGHRIVVQLDAAAADE